MSTLGVGELEKYFCMNIFKAHLDRSMSWRAHSRSDGTSLPELGHKRHWGFLLAFFLVLALGLLTLGKPGCQEVSSSPCREELSAPAHTT